MQVVRLCAPNDRNGNPRRLYLVVADNQVLHAIDEGYKGIGSLWAVYPHMQETTRTAADISVTATEYNDWKRSDRFVAS